MTTLFLIRHAQSTANADRRIQGWLDSPLSELGRQQVQALCERFRSTPLNAVYASPLARAVDTAQEIASIHNLAVMLDDRLKEYNMGQWTGLSRAEIEALSPGIDLDAEYELAVPDGETAQEMYSRIEPFLREVMSRHAGETIAIITHGGTLGMLVGTMLGLPVMRRHPFSFSNTSVTEVTYEGGRWRLQRLNDQCHLHPLKSNWRP
ncbi:MAG: histidine phosphatase family protein [Anaerolineae bacterium]